MPLTRDGQIDGSHESHAVRARRDGPSRAQIRRHNLLALRGKDERWRWYETLLKEHGAFDNYPPRPGIAGILKPNRLIEYLGRAGFVHGVETLESVDLDLGDEHTWWVSLWTNGSRAALERLPEPKLEIVRTAALKRARALKTAAGLLERHDFVYVTAVRP